MTENGIARVYATAAAISKEEEEGQPPKSLDDLFPSSCIRGVHYNPEHLDRGTCLLNPFVPRGKR